MKILYLGSEAAKSLDVKSSEDIIFNKEALLSCITFEVQDFVDFCNRRGNQGVAVALWEYREVFMEPHEKPTSRKPGDWLFVMKLDGVYYPIYHNTNRCHDLQNARGVLA